MDLTLIVSQGDMQGNMVCMFSALTIASAECMIK